MLPPLLHQATIEVLKSLESKGVQLHFADEEADSYCVELASLRGAYVVAQDSDFVVLNCEGYQGYISFDDISWVVDPPVDDILTPQESVSSIDFDDLGFQVVKKKSKSRKPKGPSTEVVQGIIPPQEVVALTFSVVHPVTLASQLGIQPSLLPLLASLLGNDVTINNDPYKYFFERRLSPALRIPRVAAVLVEILDPSKRKGGRGTIPSSVMELIQQTVNRLLLKPDQVSSGEREKLVDVIVDSILNYAITVKTEGMPQTKCAVHTDDNCSLVLVRQQELVEEMDPPNSKNQVLGLYTTAYREGRLSHKLLNIVGSATYWPSLFLEDPDRQTCQISIARGIRLWIYAIIEAGVSIPRPEPEAEVSGHEEELIDVVEEDDSDPELGQLAEALRNADLSDGLPAVVKVNSLLEPDIQGPTLEPPVVVEYVRRGSQLSGVDVDVPPLTNLSPDVAALPVVPQLASESARRALMLAALTEEDPSILADIPADRPVLVLALRWVIKALGTRQNAEERWTKREAICLIRSWGSGSTIDTLPEPTNRHIQLTYQFLSAYEAINLLSEALLISAQLPGSILGFAGSSFHEYLHSKGVEEITDPIDISCWKACQVGLDGYWGIERGAHAKKERRRANKANGESNGSLDTRRPSKAGGLFAALAQD